MAQGRSTEVIFMIKWTRTSRLSIKNPLSLMWWFRGYLVTESGLST